MEDRGRRDSTGPERLNYEWVERGEEIKEISEAEEKEQRSINSLNSSHAGYDAGVEGARSRIEQDDFTSSCGGRERSEL